MSLRYRGLGLQLFFGSITFTGGTEFNMSKENVFAGFSVKTNETFWIFPPILSTPRKP